MESAPDRPRLITQLFDDALFAAPPLMSAWGSEAATRESDADWRGGLSHPQFEYRRTPAVFGNRAGWGPLLIAPDTNLLIDLVGAFDAIESHFGIAEPIVSRDGDGPVDALRDLFAYWFHRDIRWVILDAYLGDSRRKALTPQQTAERKRVAGALRADLWERGGLERGFETWEMQDADRNDLAGWNADDRRDRLLATRFAPRARAMLPGGDGRLVAEALTEGCHVFLTEDRGVLRKAPVLNGWGLAILRPADLLDLLEDAGELQNDSLADRLFPDLLPLARFYEISGQ